ncbi:MAG TPA: pyruvate formate lyase family protein, partial [Thermoanaerobaculia bacterium]|nr:pyruvate formate lyase family protein [Thermoanaerobaculia bacterium]
MHWTQEIIPIGRLDQLLFPFYEADFREGRLTRDDAQEILDCFWIKLDEKVVRNRRYMEDHFTSSDGALTGVPGSSNFDQGALLNQWMQQITIGGVIADDEPEPKDASNAVTLLCIESARRLPLNSPTLDLRVHKGTPRHVLDAAAKALLSGGAHPVILSDDRIVPGLAGSPVLQQEDGNRMALRDARDYACDGCFETMPAGRTEFSFGYVSALDSLEKALNRGAGFANAGPQNLRGWKASYRTNAPADIDSFEDLWAILTTHIEVGCHRYLSGLIGTYGVKADYCPSPLLSAFIDGCVESGRDFTAGGARYHLFSPLMTGISTAADSLWVIKHCVFDEQRFTLDELVQCLKTNWGNETEYVGASIAPDRVAEIYALVKQQKKFGQGHAEVDELAWRLIQTFTDAVRRARLHPVHRAGFEALKAKYDTPEWPFEIILAPGVGTFEQYLFGGGFIGATPDGRRSRNGIASDLSPAPVHRDDSPWIEGSSPVQHARQVPLADGLRSYANDVMNLLP